MKKVLSLLVLALLGTNILWARDFFSATSPSGHTLYYVIEGGVAHVTHPRGDFYFNIRFENPWNGKGPTGALEIPARVTYNGNNYSVVSIGLQAFYQCSGLTSVTIPNSVTSIGDRAFQDCSGLTSVTIPNSVTSIGVWAFEGTALYNNRSNWKNDVLYIGKYLIKAESDKVSYIIAAGTKVIADGAFGGCSSLLKVDVPNSVTSIGERAFLHCSSLTSVTIPNSVTTIGDWAFKGCSNLLKVEVPSSVKSIGEDAFKGTKWVIYCGSATGSPWGADGAACPDGQ